MDSSTMIVLLCSIALLLSEPRLQECLKANFSDQEVEAEILKGGCSESKNYSVEANGQKYVIHLQSERTSANRIHRELFAEMSAVQAGIAPIIRWVSEKGDVVLMDFVSGELLTVETAKSNLSALASAIQKLHALPKNPYKKSGESARILQMIPDVKKIIPEPFLKEARRLVASYHQKNYPAATIHGDLNARNIFLTQKGVQFIDWSESGWDDPYFDLTCLTLMHDFTPEEESRFLRVYLNRFPSEEETAHFEEVKQLNLISLAMNLCLLGEDMVKENGEVLSRKEKTADWNHFVTYFANNPECTAQFFYDWGHSALDRFAEALYQATTPLQNNLTNS